MRVAHIRRIRKIGVTVKAGCFSTIRLGVPFGVILYCSVYGAIIRQ